ncbi:MAG TPA: C40 family peptidase [Bryobacteraceae bacterium]|nr:C40 family peptidase [Bryobacteraceae bacterium]
MLVWVMMSALMAGGGARGVILKPVANMYSRPSEAADVVSQAIYGSNVSLVEEQSGWAKVRTADEYTGWMQTSSIKRLSAGEPPYASRGRVARVTSLFANVYQEPDVMKRRPLETVPFETALAVTAEPESESRWMEVKLPDDRSGWVQRGDVTFDWQTLSIRETIALSKRFLGLPYYWGGVSTFGFDCSGFTQMLCGRRGVTIPRDASVQARWDGSVAVDREHLEPGDFLFFGERKVTHTGMYIGDGKFINATTHERPVVQISDLADPYWAKLYITARRIK